MGISELIADKAFGMIHEATTKGKYGYAKMVLGMAEKIIWNEADRKTLIKGCVLGTEMNPEKIVSMAQSWNNPNGKESARRGIAFLASMAAMINSLDSEQQLGGPNDGRDTIERSGKRQERAEAWVRSLKSTGVSCAKELNKATESDLDEKVGKMIVMGAHLVLNIPKKSHYADVFIEAVSEMPNGFKMEALKIFLRNRENKDPAILSIITRIEKNMLGEEADVPKRSFTKKI